jgi:endonuclease-3 related protein
MKRRKDSSAGSARVLRRMYDRLVAVYGAQAWWPAETAFEVVVGAYLTQNTSWRGVEKSILNLKMHGAMSVAGVRSFSEERLRELIRPSGYMVRKAAAIKAFVAMLDAEFGGSLDALAAEASAAARAKLLALPGVGPETADAILLYALGRPAMVVDEYLRRVVVRHGLVPEAAKYSEIQAVAVESFAVGPMSGEGTETLARHYNEFHALMVMVGKTHCGPRPKCAGCPLEEFLPKPLVAG